MSPVSRLVWSTFLLAPRTDAYGVRQINMISQDYVQYSFKFSRDIYFTSSINLAFLKFYFKESLDFENNLVCRTKFKVKFSWIAYHTCSVLHL